jgi:hypothetical protein
VARGKAEIAREAKWQKTAKLVTKKRLEMKKLRSAKEGADGSSSQEKAPELIETGAPEKK